MKGENVEKDWKQAVAWAERSAAQDHTDGIALLGFLTMKGWGLAPSFRRARALYQRSIDLDRDIVHPEDETLATSFMQILAKNIATVTPPPARHLTPPRTTCGTSPPTPPPPGRPPHGSAGRDLRDYP